MNNHITTNKVNKAHDVINAPYHYLNHPSGVECIAISAELNFCLGNAFKYIFRRKHKNNELSDLKKALWYIKREQQHRKSANVLPVNELNKIINSENELSPNNSFGKILAYIVQNPQFSKKLTK